MYKERGIPLVYNADSYADDLPYWLEVPGTDEAMLMVPYSFDNNDFKFHSPSGFTGPRDFEEHLKNAFDTLYREGEEGTPKMMSIGLHCRIVGKAGRCKALENFLEYISKKPDVWVATRLEIADRKCNTKSSVVFAKNLIDWRKEHPYKT